MNCFYYRKIKAYLNGDLIYEDVSNLHYGELEDDVSKSVSTWDELYNLVTSDNSFHPGVWSGYGKYFGKRIYAYKNPNSCAFAKLIYKKALNYRYDIKCVKMEAKNVSQYLLRELNAEEYALWCRDNIGYICPLQ